MWRQSGVWQLIIKKTGTKPAQIYRSLGCSKQNLSYWENHSFSTQYRKSVYRVIHNAGSLFKLPAEEMECLANKAGLSLCAHENGLSHVRAKHGGLLKNLYENANISERMFRYYKTAEPTKQALMAIAVSLNMTLEETDELLHKYGYCLSKSLTADMVVCWHLSTHASAAKGSHLLDSINETLYDMELPLLMTRQHCPRE